MESDHSFIIVTSLLTHRKLPPGAQWGDIGKKQNPKMVIMFLCFLYFMFLCVVTRPNVYMSMLVVHDLEDIILWIDELELNFFTEVMTTLLGWRRIWSS